jgi:uncharacterized phage protein (TIGR02218 family)
MSFATLEGGNYDGAPVLLYEFTRGVEAVFGYAAADQDITTSNGTREIVYVAAPISNSGQTQKGTAVTDVFEVTCPASLEIVQWYRYTPPSDTIYLAVRRFHHGDTQSVIVWLGQVVAVEENSESVATIRCQQVSITLKRGGLRMTWQRGCVHALYDQNCTVDKSIYMKQVWITATSPDGVLAVTPSPPSDWFWNGGIIEFDMPGLTGVQERRLIEVVFNQYIRPYGQMDGYSIGQELRLYPGCKRTGEWCNAFFHNIDNYGGFEFMPNRSPYSGDSVF